MSSVTSSTAATSPKLLLRFVTRTSASGCGKRFLQKLEPAVGVFIRDHERHEDADHVAVRSAREQHEPALVRRGGGRSCTRRCLFLELEREHRTEPANFRN